MNLLDLNFSDWTAADDVKINGGIGAETIIGSEVSDSMAANAGDDTAFGYDGADTIGGGLGDDTLNGGAGDDTLTGGAGDDMLSGGSDDDRLDGGSADDRIQGGGGNDLAAAGAGDDEVDLGSGDDALRIANSLATGTAFSGFDGNDTYAGGGGRDTISFAGLGGGLLINLAAGSTRSRTPTAGENIGLDRIVGFENVVGSKGADSIVGSAAAELLNGSEGNDRLTGGGGEDTLIGGIGSDRFIFEALADSGATIATADLVSGFRDGGDRIDLSDIDAVGSTSANESFSNVLVNKGSGFTFSTANQNFTEAGQIIAFRQGAAAVGADMILAVNTDNNLRDAEMMIAIDIRNGGTTLSADDFLL